MDWSVENGLYPRAEANELKAAGERAVERLTRERERFERWRAWCPDPTWPPAALPSGWELT